MPDNTWIVGDYREFARPPGMSLVIADPVYDDKMVNDVIEFFTGPLIVFSSVEDLYNMSSPEQTCFWCKPSSTKNTTKKYSRFVEAITFWNGVKFNDRKVHWSTRTGVFNDTLIDNSAHPWKKPESLIEKLLTNHYVDGVVYDPCAGSGTVHDVCKRMGIPSVSVEIDPRYAR